MKKNKSFGSLAVLFSLFSLSLTASNRDGPWIGFIATFPSVVYENLNATLCLRFASPDSYTNDVNIMIDDAGSKAFAPILLRLSRSARKAQL